MAVWLYGYMAIWPCGYMAVLLYGYMATCLYGYMVIWLYGLRIYRYMASWLYGYRAIWIHGYMALWLYSYMVIWLKGYLAISLYGSKAIWLCSHMNTWLHGSKQQLAAAGSSKHADTDLTYMCEDCNKKKTNYPNKEMPLSVSSNAQVLGPSWEASWTQVGTNIRKKRVPRRCSKNVRKLLPKKSRKTRRPRSSGKGGSL